jgi:hypothetical protein
MRIDEIARMRSKIMKQALEGNEGEYTQLLAGYRA